MTEGEQYTDKQIENIVNSVKLNRQDSNPIPKEGNVSKIKRIVAAGFAAATIATGAGSLAGCEQIQNSPTTVTTVESSETDPSVTTSENGTSVKVDPVVVTETTIETTAPTETEVNAELAEAPEITGLSKEIESGKVVYKAVEGNEYGIEAGEFAGEYNANVSVEGSRVGGVILEPEVITKIMGDKSEIIPPLDITGVTAETGLNIINTTDLFATEAFNKNHQTVIVEFNGQLELINPYIEKNQFCRVAEINSNIEYKKDDGTIIDFKNQVGLVPFLAFDAQEDGRTQMGMGDYFYLFDVENTDKVNNISQDFLYKKGEKIGVLVNSSLAIYYNYYSIEETTIKDLARTDEGAVIFAYPQETVEEGK